MIEDVGDDLADPLGREHHLFGVDGLDVLVGNVVGHAHRVLVRDPEGQHVLVVDGVDDRVGVQAVTEDRLGGVELRTGRVLGEDWRTREAEQVIALERLANRGAHVAELTAMALVEDHDDMPAEDLVASTVPDEPDELLDGRDDDP